MRAFALLLATVAAAELDDEVQLLQTTRRQRTVVHTDNFSDYPQGFALFWNQCEGAQPRLKTFNQWVASGASLRSGILQCCASMGRPAQLCRDAGSDTIFHDNFDRDDVSKRLLLFLEERGANDPEQKLQAPTPGQVRQTAVRIVRENYQEAKRLVQAQHEKEVKDADEMAKLLASRAEEARKVTEQAKQRLDAAELSADRAEIAAQAATAAETATMAAVEGANAEAEAAKNAWTAAKSAVEAADVAAKAAEERAYSLQSQDLGVYSDNAALAEKASTKKRSSEGDDDEDDDLKHEPQGAVLAEKASEIKWTDDDDEDDDDLKHEPQGAVLAEKASETKWTDDDDEDDDDLKHEPQGAVLAEKASETEAGDRGHPRGR